MTASRFSTFLKTDGLVTFALFGIFMQAANLFAATPQFAPADVTFCGKPAPAPSSSSCGFCLLAAGDGPQVAFMAKPAQCVVAVREGEQVCIAIAVQGLPGPFTFQAEAHTMGGQRPLVTLSLDNVDTSKKLKFSTTVLKVSRDAGKAETLIRLKVAGGVGDTAVGLQKLCLVSGDDRFDVPLAIPPAEAGPGAPPVLPPYRPAIEQALIEWDWRMQDGIGTERSPSTYAAAVEQTLQRGDRLIADLRGAGVELAEQARQWDELRQRWEGLKHSQASSPPRNSDEWGRTWESQWGPLWREVHAVRRKMALSNPLAKTGPIAFVKQVPGTFSHQLTQYYGRYAKPGGGVFVLERPGETMQCRSLTAGALKEGSYQHLDVAPSGDKLLFAYCECDTVPTNGLAGQQGRYYRLYEVGADGSKLKQLTDGPYNDFAPRYLPDGKIVFISTRRGGWHRCGTPGCENYTLAIAEADGSNPHTVSFHETQEWDPAVLADGRIVYCRWDYVDRHAIYYEQLWTVRTDGSSPAAFYGNNTFNPVGTWEPRAIPGSHRVMATAAAHHAMTAGSIVLIDPRRGVDGLDPIARVTPDALFPESEVTLAPNWRGPVPVNAPPMPVEQERWRGHCYRSPFPMSETYFLAAYSFDGLVGEPKANPPNMFGLYLVDAFGNKELLYRDLNIASLWPAPLRSRPRTASVERVAADAPPVPVTPTSVVRFEKQAAPTSGTCFLQNVYAANPTLPPGSVKRLRIVQIVPKSTPGANNPTVGLANASPGKQVVGTVPVEPDGSAFFRAPAGVPLAFQVLDELGQAVQIMRSVTYLQAGEIASCVGCHEHRMTAPPPAVRPTALARGPSVIEPGPDGSKPLSYPILVQPVLDKQCVRCHSAEKPEGKVILTGEAKARYTTSYNALAPLVPFSQWTGPDPRKFNSEPISTPGFFGARGSKLMKLLLAGHEGVKLSPEDIERLVTWMDANALFYGTFDPADQARQQRGERIAGPKLE